MDPMPTEAKGPLQSKTFWLGFITLLSGVVGKYNPAVGGFLKDNADTILTLVGAASVAARGTTTKALDPKDWTLFGVGKKW